MCWSRHTLVLFLALLAGCAEKNASAPDALDIVLAGGTVYNGRDAAPVVADVGIAGDRIVTIGNLKDHSADRRIDVTGLAVMPGIIDIHSHAIRPNAARSGLYLYPDSENLIRQGVTSVIGGPDGRSPLPISDDFARLEVDPPAVNYGTFVGHGSVRSLVMGNDDRHATGEELLAMRDAVHDAMKSGAFGLSSGLLYAPGKFAPEAELIELAKVVGEYSGIYISHMRDEALGLLDSVRETINIGEQAGIPAQITHHKAIDRKSVV